MRYEFGGKVYTQEKLVWGQVRQIASALKGISFDGEMSVVGLIDAIGEKLSTALAVVLTEEGTSVKDKDLDVLAKEIEATIPIDIVMQVVEDFFICNPTALILEKLTGLMEGVQERMNLQAKKLAESTSIN